MERLYYDFFLFISTVMGAETLCLQNAYNFVLSIFEITKWNSAQQIRSVSFFVKMYKTKCFKRIDL